MAKQPVFLYLATFESIDDAKAAYARIKELHGAGVIGTYDGAVVSKDAEGNVHVHKDEKPTQYAAWTGLAVGAVVGLLFPPLFLGDLAFALFGAGAGALVGHFRSGMSRGDARELGGLIDESQAAVIIVGKSALAEAIDADQMKALRQWEKQVPMEQDEFERSLDEAVRTIAS